MSLKYFVVLACFAIGCGGSDSNDKPAPDAEAPADLSPPTGDLTHEAGPDLALPPTAAALTVDDGSYQFDPVANAAVSATATFKFTNVGGAPTAALLVDINGDGFAAFHIVGDDCTGQLLAAQASCHVAVDLGSATAGDFAATLRVHADPGGVGRVDLSGIVTVPALAFTPATQSLGTLLQGSSSAPASLQLGNNGGATSGVITLGALPAGLAVATDGCTGKTLAGGASCPLTVTLTMGANTTGLFSATLAAAAQPGGSANAVLTATAQTTGTISVSSVNFGSLGSLFGTAAPQTMTVTNIGDEAALIQTVQLSQNYIVLIDSSACVNQTLAPHASCPLQVSLPNWDTTRESGTVTVSVHVTGGHDGTGTATASYYTDGYLLFLGNYYSALGSVVSSDGQTCAVEDCEFRFHYSQPTITLTAQPFAGDHFVSWAGGDSDRVCGNSSNPACVITFTAANWVWLAEPTFAVNTP